MRKTPIFFCKVGQAEATEVTYELKMKTKVMPSQAFLKLSCSLCIAHGLCAFFGATIVRFYRSKREVERERQQSIESGNLLLFRASVFTFFPQSHFLPHFGRRQFPPRLCSVCRRLGGFTSFMDAHLTSLSLCILCTVSYLALTSQLLLAAVMSFRRPSKAGAFT